MNIRITSFLGASFLALCVTARALVLTEFDSGSLSSFAVQSSWDSNVTLGTDGSRTFATIGGTSKDDGKIEFMGSMPDFTGLGFVSITFRSDAGNVASGLSFVLTDVNWSEASTSIAASATLGSWTTVYAPLNTSGVDMSNLMSWSLVGGNFAPVADVRMSIDQVSVLAAVPEPSTYAAVLGAMVLGVVGYRRFRRS